MLENPNEYGLTKEDLEDKNLKNVTLNKFLSKHNSEDNTSFSELLKLEE